MRTPAAILAVTLVGLLGATPAGASRRAAAASAAPIPSAITAQPDIAEPLCNGGRGIRIAAPFGGREENAVVASATMADDSTLIAFTAIYPGKDYALLDSVTSACARNSGFGDDGAARITIPKRLGHAIKGSPPFGTGLWINAVAARSGGGAILAGTFKGAWVVGEITAQGRLAKNFGTGGWKVLPYGGEVTKVLQEASGRILIAGSQNPSGCCTINWASALSASGRLERSFGHGGRVKLPTGEDSGVEALAVLPGGDILANVNYGNMGCWGSSPALLSASGQPVPSFAQRLASFWKELGFGAFVGEVYGEGEGFSIAGTGQAGCFESNSPSSSATGLLAHFNDEGELLAAPTRFPSSVYGLVQAFNLASEVFLVESPYATPSRVTIEALSSDGAVEDGFAVAGSASIRLPGSLPEVEAEPSGPETVTLLARRPGILELIRLHV